MVIKRKTFTGDAINMEILTETDWKNTHHYIGDERLKILQKSPKKEILSKGKYDTYSIVLVMEQQICRLFFPQSKVIKNYYQVIKSRPVALMTKTGNLTR